MHYSVTHEPSCGLIFNLKDLLYEFQDIFNIFNEVEDFVKFYGLADRLLILVKIIFLILSVLLGRNSLKEIHQQIVGGGDLATSRLVRFLRLLTSILRIQINHFKRFLDLL